MDTQANTTINYNIANATHCLTLNVKLTGYKVWKTKLKVAVWLMELAAWLIGCNINIETDNSNT